MNDPRIDNNDIDMYIMSKVVLGTGGNNTQYQISCYIHSKDLIIYSKYPSTIYWKVLGAYNIGRHKLIFRSVGWKRICNSSGVTLINLWRDYENKSLSGFRSTGRDYNEDGSITLYIDDSGVDINKVREICSDKFGVAEIKVVVRIFNYKRD